ncbi:MAG: YihY/virulence factor BrkB family protein [Anaerovorax sp.]
MSKRRLLQMIALGIKQFRDPYYQGFAAQLAFYFLLSLVPMAIVLSQLLGFFSISLDTLGGWIDEYVSGEVAEILKGLISYTPTGAMNTAFIVIALWASSRAQFSMMRITNYTFTGGKSTGNGYFRERIRAVKTMILTLFTIVFSLIILVYGELILQIIVGTLVRDDGASYRVNDFWLYIRWPVAMALYFLMVSYNYYVLPSKRVTFREILPGSIFSSVGMLLVTGGYSIYTSYVVNYDIIYGSLASIVALMFWFFFLAWALVLGIMLNKVWGDTK